MRVHVTDFAYTTRVVTHTAWKSNYLARRMGMDKRAVGPFVDAMPWGLIESRQRKCHSALRKRARLCRQRAVDMYKYACETDRIWQPVASQVMRRLESIWWTLSPDHCSCARGHVAGRATTCLCYSVTWWQRQRRYMMTKCKQNLHLGYQFVPDWLHWAMTDCAASMWTDSLFTFLGVCDIISVHRWCNCWLVDT